MNRTQFEEYVRGFADMVIDAYQRLYHLREVALKEGEEARGLAEEYRDKAYEAQKISCNEYRRFGKPKLPWEGTE